MKTGRNRTNCFKITNLLLKRQTLTIFNGGTADMADMYFDCFYSLRVACAWRKFCIGFFLRSPPSLSLYLILSKN